MWQLDHILAHVTAVTRCPPRRPRGAARAARNSKTQVNDRADLREGNMQGSGRSQSDELVSYADVTTHHDGGIRPTPNGLCSSDGALVPCHDTYSLSTHLRQAQEATGSRGATCCAVFLCGNRPNRPAYRALFMLNPFLNLFIAATDLYS